VSGCCQTPRPSAAAPKIAALLCVATGCAVMQVPQPLVDLGPVELDEDRTSGIVGPFTYELARDEKFFVNAQDRREVWDFGVTFEGRTLGSGTCRQQIRWPGQAVGDPPRRNSDLRLSLECDLRSLTSTPAITLSLQSDESGREWVGVVRRGVQRLSVSSTREIEGSRFPAAQRMGFIVEREGVPWAAIQTANTKQAWLPPPKPGEEDLLGLVIVALATARPFMEEILTP
jgi:hypothetical protein